MSSRTVSASAQQGGWIHNAGTLRAAMLTDVGLRELNEDAVHVDAEHGIFIVADGIGGLPAGEVASTAAVDVVRRKLADAQHRIAAASSLPARQRRADLSNLLREAVHAAHHAIRRLAMAQPERYGMGTTLDLVLIAENDAYIAHVGDTRTYLIRDAQAASLTRNHTVAEELLTRGRLSGDEVLHSPVRSVLVNALGSRTDVVVDLSFVPIRAGDQLLLCSDGLYEYFTDGELVERASWGDPELAVRELVVLAVARGGRDNITGVLVDVVEGSSRAPTAVDADTSSGVPVAIDEGLATQPWGDDR